MKMVSIKDLKRRLSKLIGEAESGTPILITRHKKPVACLKSAAEQHLRIGERFGAGRIKPLLKGPTKGDYLKALLADRRSGER